MMSQYQKRHVWTEKLSKTEKAFALSNENGHIWTDKNDTKTLRVERQFLKNVKKNFCVFNENRYVWTGPDSINLDANTR